MIDSEIEMKWLGRKHTANTHNKTSLIGTSHVCHRRRVAGRNQHTHTHTHTHTRAWSPIEVYSIEECIYSHFFQSLVGGLKRISNFLKKVK